MSMDAADVKYIGKELGADLVGIASADVLNAHPPDPKYPQTPERIWPERHRHRHPYPGGRLSLSSGSASPVYGYGGSPPHG